MIPATNPLRLLRPLAAVVFLCCVFPSAAFPQTRAATTDAVGKFTGPGSCASTSCHGSILPRSENDVLQNEYSTWIVKDKHSKAYAALTGPVGERIASILNLGRRKRRRDAWRATRSIRPRPTALDLSTRARA